MLFCATIYSCKVYIPTLRTYNSLNPVLIFQQLFRILPHRRRGKGQINQEISVRGTRVSHISNGSRISTAP